MLYKSKNLDLRPFGVYNIRRAVLTADADDGIVYRVSFDGGKTWRVTEPNTPFLVRTATGVVKVEIKFPANKSEGIYMVSASGVFPLSVGTRVFFKSADNTFSTTIGPEGRYNATLPQGTYQVYYMQSGNKVVLLDDYNPNTYVFRQPDDLDKENTIQMFLSGIDWANFSVYDTFKDTSKLGPESTARVDLMQNLVADSSNAVVRYWALVFSADE